MAQVDRFSVTMPPEVGEGVRQAAARQALVCRRGLPKRRPTSCAMSSSALLWTNGRREDGSFTQAELDEAASRLGLAPRPDVA